MQSQVAVAILCAGVMSLGCGGAGETAAPTSQAAAHAADAVRPVQVAPARAMPLANTDWRLVAMQSMDDATGTARPSDPSLYTMRLNADGSAAMRLNCNRAMGKWSAEPGPGVTSGRFEFGPLAGTRAFCPPPSLDQRVTAQAQYIRSYLLKDGRLHLSLMADGGIWVWEPHTDVPFETEPDPALEPAILKASPAYFEDKVYFFAPDRATAAEQLKTLR